MHDFESKGSALRAAGAIVLTLAAGAAWAQAAAPADAAAAAADQRRVNVNEYIVRGNTVLEARDIEKAVYPYLGPDRTLSDIEAAREALQTIYQERGYQSVYVDLPEQQVADGIVFLQVSETKVGRVRGRRQALFAADHPRRSARAAGRRGAELQQGPGRADQSGTGAPRARWCRWSRKAACRAPWTWT